MDTVTYTAESGYHFADFEKKISNGITVERISDKVVTVSGTPTGNVRVTIPDAIKSGSTASVTKAPVAKSLTYSGSPQELVTAGEATGGTMNYALGKDETVAPDLSSYAASIPKGTDAGTWYVWYMAKGEGDYADSEPAGPVKVTIGKAAHKDMSDSYESKYGTDNTLDLAGYIEKGAVFGKISVSDEGSVLNGDPSLSDNVLYYSFKDDQEKLGKSAVVEIPVKNATNYLDYKVILTLTVSSCAHEHTELRNAVQATCISKGYSGDIYCTDCGNLVKKGTETQVDPDRHMHTEVREAVPGTCTTPGHLGDTYCTGCGKLVKEGESTGIDPDNHDPDEGVVTKEPTHLADGVKTYTCRRCRRTYTEPVPRLTDDEDSNTLVEDIRELYGDDAISENVQIKAALCPRSP